MRMTPERSETAATSLNTPHLYTLYTLYTLTLYTPPLIQDENGEDHHEDGGGEEDSGGVTKRQTGEACKDEENSETSSEGQQKEIERDLHICSATKGQLPVHSYGAHDGELEDASYHDHLHGVHLVQHLDHAGVGGHHHARYKGEEETKETRAEF